MDAHEPPDRPPREGPIISVFADDEEMLELIEFFVGQLEVHVHAIQAALDTHDVGALKMVSHQLKGAAGGYGFPQIGDTAAEVEREAMAEEADVNALREKAETLITLCQRAAA